MIPPSVQNPEALIGKIVHRFRWAVRGGGLSREDLMQIGRIAYFRAQSQWRDDRAATTSFAGWAANLIRQEVSEAAQEQSTTVRIPSKRQVAAWKAGEVLPNRSVSLTAPDAGCDASAPLDLIGRYDACPENDVDLRRDVAQLQRALAEIHPRQREVLRRRFCEEQAFPECGRALGVGAERARQLQEKGLDALRGRMLRPRRCG